MALQIKEAEADSVADLGAFVDAELSYYDRCRDVLLQMKRDWPARYITRQLCFDRKPILMAP